MNYLSKRSIQFVFLFLTLAASISSQAKVPSAVKKALLDKFPNATRIAWKHYLKDEYQATFMINDDEAHIFIGHKGEFIESYVQLHEEDIPQELLQQLKLIEDDSNVHYVLMTTNSSNVQYYKTKVEINNQMYELSFDYKFALLSKILIE